MAAALEARRRYSVQLIDEPVAAAAGAGLDLAAGAGGFIVDVGGGTTEVAAVAGWRVVRAESLRMAGNAMDEAIVNAARSGLGLILSQRAARQLKVELGLTGGQDGWAEAVGLDAARRTPRLEKVPGELVAGALEPVVSAIGRTVQEVLSDIPAGLAEDVMRGKVRLTGGGALLPGLANRIEVDRGDQRGRGRGPAALRGPRRGADGGDRSPRARVKGRSSGAGEAAARLIARPPVQVRR